jgi:hypothetical protein
MGRPHLGRPFVAVDVGVEDVAVALAALGVRATADAGGDARPDGTAGGDGEPELFVLFGGPFALAVRPDGLGPAVDALI